MKLSVVATLYRSAASLTAFYERATAAARAFAGDDYEIVLVNDGSPDDSLAIAIALHAVDAHVVVVDLSRNFGHHKAIVAGLEQARGDHVWLLDSDLEEEPEWLGAFAAQMQAEGCDVVYGQQAARKGGAFERWSGKIYYPFVRAVTGLDLPKNFTTARLMTRRYVNAVLLYKEREAFFAGLLYIAGFEQRSHTVTKHSFSPSTYRLRHKLSMVLNSITSFSNAPLIFIFYVGAAISLVAGIYSLYLVINWLMFARPASGWTSVMVSIWLLGGLIICFLGVIGIYVSKIFSETKQRPSTIVRQLYDRAR